MRLERHPDHWRLVGGPVPPGAAAITLGPLISIRSRSATNALLLRHEAVHVEQWRRLGVLRFLAEYLGSYLRLRLACYPHRSAYRRIPLEVEAEWRARRTADTAGAGDMARVGA
jgi:hypothetical protein